MSRWRIVQGMAGAAIVVAAIAAVAGQWESLTSQQFPWHIRWGWIAGSLLITWTMYAALMLGWRHLIVAAGESIAVPAAAEVWLLSSLGKYVPGKIWTIAGMAVLAQRRGVDPATATSAAVTMQLLSIVAGVAIAAVTLGSESISGLAPGGWQAAGILLLLSAAGLTLVSSSRFCRWAGRATGRPGTVRPISFRSSLTAMVPNLLAWLGYGTALIWLLRGTMDVPEPGWSVATGAFTLSYLAGYLFLLAPGGIGVREGVLVLVLQDVMGAGPAVALAAASRLALTVNELGVVLPLLMLSRGSRDLT